jgi:hypothetical protein
MFTKARIILNWKHNHFCAGSKFHRALKINGTIKLALRCSQIECRFFYVCLLIIWYSCFTCAGRDSSVGIAIGYMLDGPVIESRVWLDFPYPSRTALGPTSFLYRMSFVETQWPTRPHIPPKIQAGQLITHPHIAP